MQLWIEVNAVTLHKLSEELKAVQRDILEQVTFLWPGSEMIENIGKTNNGSPLNCVLLFACLQNSLSTDESICTSMCSTFIAAQLDIGKQPYLDNLPEEPEHQVRFPLLQILSSDVDDLAPDG